MKRITKWSTKRHLIELNFDVVVDLESLGIKMLKSVVCSRFVWYVKLLAKTHSHASMLWRCEDIIE